MSYVKCPECGKEIAMFGKSELSDIVKEINVDILGRIPIDPKIAQLVDEGNFEHFVGDYLEDAIKKMENIL